jgi:hypothetical protein
MRKNEVRHTQKKNTHTQHNEKKLLLKFRLVDKIPVKIDMALTQKRFLKISS